jgi:hypothetical protein
MASITKVIPEVAPTYVLELTEAELIYLKLVVGATDPRTDQAIIDSSSIPVSLAHSVPTADTAQNVWTALQREVHSVYNNEILVVKEYDN